MFPLTSNEAYIKPTGERSTLGAELGKESYTLPTASADTKGGVKVGTGLKMTGEVLSADQVPAHTIADAGKVLSVDDEGLLEWGVLPASGTKIYYKTWEKNFGTDMVIAKFSDSAASSSGIHIAKFNSDNGGNDVSINGYTPISAIAIDSFTGYAYMVGLQQMGATAQYGYQVTFAIGSKEITKSGCKVRVFYVKNEDIAQLT